MKSVISRMAIALAVLAGVLGLVACGGGDDTTASGTSEEGTTATAGGEEVAAEGPILIGAAIDETNLMKFGDIPAVEAARLEAEKYNKNGGINGREIKIVTGNTQLDPNRSKSVAEDLVNQGAEVLWTTCDVDWATPSIQVGLKAGLLTLAPCIGTDQMGPKRFGAEGELAFSFGNVAQDEGAALAEMVLKRGWKKVNMVTDKAIVFTQNDCEAFKQRFEEKGGEIVLEETFTSGDNTLDSVANRLNNSPADAIVTCAIQTDVATIATGTRSVGNQTPIAGPWSLDGTFWLPKNPKFANNIWYITYASIYGDDPNPEVNELVKRMEAKGVEPTVGGFITGAALIDGLAKAIEENNGSTDGEALAESMVQFEDLETISGNISFSEDLHTVHGREYRVMEIKNGKPHFVELIEAGTPAEL